MPAWRSNRLVEPLEDGALRERMRAAGVRRAKEFTWERAGAAVLGVYARELGR